MARNRFGGTTNDITFAVTKIAGFDVPRFAPNSVIPCWTAKVSGTLYTDFQTIDGAPLTQIISDSLGLFPEFDGPDNVEEMWVPNGAGGRSLLKTTTRLPGPQGNPGNPGAAGGTDAATAGWVTTGTLTPAAVAAKLADIDADPSSAFRVQSDARQTSAYGPTGANVARFVQRARAGEPLAICALGDSVLEGTTVTTPATDGIMHLLQADIATRFGNTITMTNRATSGYTVMRSFMQGNVGTALADKADLYILAFAKNDIVSDLYGPSPQVGVPLDASLAGLERMVRLIRRDVPKADIILLSENPYWPVATTYNPLQVIYNTRMKRLAAAYGCEYVDGYTPFIDLGNFSAYSWDGTHPNTAGHRLLADTVLDHLTDVPKTPIQTAQPGTTGVYAPEAVNVATSGASQFYGYLLQGFTGTSTFGPLDTTTWTNVGTWTGSAGHYITSVAASYAEFTFFGTELYAFLDATVAKAAVVDISVDGTVVWSNVGFTSNPKLGWVAVATGLTAAAHTVRLTLKSGELNVYTICALAAPQAGAIPFSPTYVSGSLGARASDLAVTTAAVTQYTGSIALPSFWNSMNVVMTGHLGIRVTGTTTTIRKGQVRLTVGGTLLLIIPFGFPPLTSEMEMVIPINYSFPTKTATTALLLTAQLTSTDTDLVVTTNYALSALRCKAS